MRDRLSRYWFRNWTAWAVGLTQVLVILVSFLIMRPFADSSGEALMCALAVWSFPLGALALRPFLDYSRLLGGIWIDGYRDVDIATHLRDAYQTRLDRPNRQQARFVAAKVPGDENGIMTLLIGEYPEGSRRPRVVQAEQIKLGHDPSDRLVEYLEERFVSLAHQAEELEEAVLSAQLVRESNQSLIEEARQEQVMQQRMAKELQLHLARA